MLKLCIFFDEWTINAGMISVMNNLRNIGYQIKYNKKLSVYSDQWRRLSTGLQ